MCVKGEVNLKLENGKAESIKIGETVLIPASLKNITIIPKEYSELLEIYID